MVPRFRWEAVFLPHHVAQAVEEFNSIGRVPVQKKSGSHLVLRWLPLFYKVYLYSYKYVAWANLRLKFGTLANSMYPSRCAI
jgi:hypothetical protein